MSNSQPKSLLDIAELAIVELGDRLKDDPSKVPAHVLSKLATDAQKVLERREKEGDETEAKPFSLLDELPTLPPDRALALAKDEAARLEGELDRVHIVIRDLERGQGGRAEEEGEGQRAEGGTAAEG